jgi:GNAT superfamily N-acetyltransferase
MAVQLPTLTASGSAPSYLIEQAQRRDAIALAQVTVDAWRAAYEGLLPRAMLEALSLEEHTAHFDARLTAGTPRFFVYRAGEQIQGWIAYEERRTWFRPWLELAGLYVHPDQWRRGIGGALVQHLQTLTAGEPRHEVRLWVIECDERARAFYAALGLTPSARRRVVERGGYGVNEMEYRGMTWRS